MLTPDVVTYAISTLRGKWPGEYGAVPSEDEILLAAEAVAGRGVTDPATVSTPAIAFIIVVCDVITGKGWRHPSDFALMLADLEANKGKYLAEWALVAQRKGQRPA